MKKQIFITALLCLVLPPAICAQSIRQQVGKKETKTVVKPQPQKPTGGTLTQTKPKAEPDTVYCLSTKKQHGWFSPMQIVSQDFAMHYGTHYRFTRKNAAGHWTKMEVLDGYGRLKPDNGMAPYILNIGAEEHDKNINMDWLNKVKTECVYEFIADPSGESIIQERAFDKWHNLVYSYSRVQIGKPEDRKFIGSYRDYYGLPTEMRNDSAYTYGTLVVLTEDRWGNDSIIQYVDAKGTPKNNSWGVAQEHYIQDCHGLMLRKQSCDIEGTRVIDLAGNCAWQANWNTKTYTLESEICLDDKLQPMRMPDVLGYGGPTVGTIKQVYKYDDYKRQIETKFVTTENKPDTNLFGAHRIESVWDDHGNRLSVTAYGIDGKLAAFDKSGTARWNAEYDEKGRMKYIEWYDRNNQLNSTEGYLSRKKEVYGDDDYLDEQVYWGIENGKEDTCYYYKRTPSSYYNRYNDGSYRIDSLDAKGRTISSSFYDRNMNPFSYEHIGYQRYVTDYVDFANGTDYTTKYYDVNGNLCGEKAIQRCLVDSINHIEKFWDYDSKGNLVQTYIQKKDSLGNVLCQSDMNAFGVICRAGGSGRARLYNGEVFWTPKKSESSLSQIIGKDEFGEPDYINGNGEPFYYFIKKADGSSVYYDENSHVINNFKSFCDDCPKAISIEITDSIAYRLGFKDNDVIIVCGNYVWTNSNHSDYHSFRTKWAINCITANSNPYDILVFRVNPETLEYGIKEIKGLSEPLYKLGILAHVRFLTQRQNERIFNSMLEEIRLGNKTLSAIDFSVEEKEGSRYVIVGSPDLYRDERAYPYPKEISAPALLVGASIKDKNIDWVFTEGIAKLEDFFTHSSRRKDSQKYPVLTFYLSRDLKTVDALDVEGKYPGVRWLDVKVSDEEYLKMKDLAKLAQTQLKKESHTGEYVKPKQVVGKWIGQIKSEHGVVELDYVFAADGSVSIHAISEVKFPLSDDVKAVINVSLNVSGGTWGVEGSFIFIDLEDDISNVSIGDIDIIGIDNDKKEETLVMLRSYIEQNKDEFVSELDLDKIVKTGELRVNNLKSGVMELENLQLGNSIVFAKLKK